MDSKIVGGPTLEEMLEELAQEVHETSEPPEGSFSVRAWVAKMKEKNPSYNRNNAHRDLARMVDQGKLIRTDVMYSVGGGAGYFYYFPIADKD